MEGIALLETRRRLLGWIKVPGEELRKNLNGQGGLRRALKAKERNFNFISSDMSSRGYTTLASAGSRMNANKHSRLKGIAVMGVFSERYVNAAKEERRTRIGKA